MIVLNVQSVAVLLVLPVLVAASIETLHLKPAQAGEFAAADMLGACISSIVVSLAMRGRGWRVVLAAAVSLLCVSNAITSFLTTFKWLLPVRMLAGLAEGALLAITNATIGGRAQADRLFGLATAAQLAFGASAIAI